MKRAIVIVLTLASILAAQYSPPGGGTGSSISIPGPITLSGSGAGLDLFGCGTQTIPGSPTNAVGVIGATSCTGQHLFSLPTAGAGGAGQTLQSTGGESGGITPMQWASAGGSTFPLTFVQEAQYGGTTSTNEFHLDLSQDNGLKRQYGVPDHFVRWLANYDVPKRMDR